MIIPDRRALQILARSHWTSKGWIKKSERVISEEDFLYAKEKGLMFDPVEMDHDTVGVLVKESVEAVSPKEVANAFVCSLKSRRLDLRSALGSFAFLQHYPLHTMAPDICRQHCAICGHRFSIDANRLSYDLNSWNFTRFKWAGTSHDRPGYAAFDLVWFKRFGAPEPITEDVVLLRRLIESIDQAPGDTTSGALQRFFPPELPSNKQERDTLVGLLGLAGILETQNHPGYLRSFVKYEDRELPNRHFIDMAYPACWWRRSDGINRAAIDFWFGHLL